jgi:hypothetical protein
MSRKQFKRVVDHAHPIPGTCVLPVAMEAPRLDPGLLGGMGKGWRASVFNGRKVAFFFSLQDGRREGRLLGFSLKIHPLAVPLFG